MKVAKRAGLTLFVVVACSVLGVQLLRLFFGPQFATNDYFVVLSVVVPTVAGILFDRNRRLEHGETHSRIDELARQSSPQPGLPALLHPKPANTSISGLSTAAPSTASHTLEPATVGRPWDDRGARYSFSVKRVVKTGLVFYLFYPAWVGIGVMEYKWLNLSGGDSTAYKAGAMTVPIIALLAEIARSVWTAGRTR